MVYNQKTKFLLGAAGVGMCLAAYFFVSRHQHSINPDDQTIPTFGQLSDGVKQIFSIQKFRSERWITIDIWATFSRFFIGISIAVICSIIIGMAMGCIPYVQPLLLPMLSLFAKVPPTAILAVFFVIVGVDLNFYIAMIGFGIIPTLAQTIDLSIREIPEELLFKAKTLGASKCEIVYNLVYKHILPKLLDAVRLQIGPAMVYLIAGEMLCADSGFGYRIRMQARLLNMHIVYPYLAMLAGFGFGMDYVLRHLRMRWCRWYAS